MLLPLCIKIIFWIIAIRYSIATVSYCINHNAKKTNHRGGGNWRMPKEVSLALINGLVIKGRPQNLSCVTTIEFNEDEPTSQFANPLNTNLIPPHLLHTQSNRKQFPFPLSETGNNNFINHSKFYPAVKMFTKNNIPVSFGSFDLQFTSLLLLKNSQAINTFPKNNLACRM